MSDDGPNDGGEKFEFVQTESFSLENFNFRQKYPKENEIRMIFAFDRFYGLTRAAD